jgi:hypothetical protein
MRLGLKATDFFGLKVVHDQNSLNCTHDKSPLRFRIARNPVSSMNEQDQYQCPSLRIRDIFTLFPTQSLPI